jgi:hypothetical protein
VSDDRRFELPQDLSPDEERAIIRALERYFAQESPHPHPWVLAGRIDAIGFGALQARHHADAPWRRFGGVLFVRRCFPPHALRGDAG